MGKIELALQHAWLQLLEKKQKQKKNLVKTTRRSTETCRGLYFLEYGSFDAIGDDRLPALVVFVPVSKFR